MNYKTTCKRNRKFIMSVMFMSMTVRDGGGDIYLTNAPVGCLELPCRTYSLLRHVSAVPSSLNETSSTVQKLWFVLIYLGGQTRHH